MLRLLIWLSKVTFCVIKSIGAVGHKNNGYQELMLTYKFPTEKTKIYRSVFESTSYDMYANMFASECHIWIRDTQSLNNEKFNDCANKHGKALVVLGDSHAMNLYNIVAKNEASPFVLGVSQGDCPTNNKDFCHYKTFLEFLKFNTNKIDRVIYHQSGSWLMEDRNGNVDSQLAFEGHFSSFSYDDIRAALEYLEKLSKSYSVNVTWIGPFLEFRRNPLEVIGTDDLMFVNPNSVRLFGDLEAAMIGILSSSSEIEYLKFSDVFFEPIKPFIGNCFVFRDRDHYSQCGEKIIAERSNLSWLKER
ncbi:MAG: hypothetical protein HOI70_03765 [Opitutae bacterium]|nr:hypothetical protein [Opitutae bacterium]